MMPASDPKQSWWMTITEGPTETNTANEKGPRSRNGAEAYGGHARDHGWRPREDAESHWMATGGYGRPPGDHGRPPGSHRGQLPRTDFSPAP